MASDLAGQKHCSMCQTAKPLTAFSLKKSGRPRNRCKLCRARYQQTKYSTGGYSRTIRPYRLKKNYGITQQQYDDMFVAQGGVCRICETRNGISAKKEKALAVDHDHATGRVRGLLCSSCNRGLGLLKDSVAVLENAIKYLKTGG